jgi:hypothetical protein
VKLDVWVPSQLESGQAVEIAAGGTSEKQELEAGEKRTLEIPIRLEPGETLELSVRAEKTWSPKASGTSGDDRLLAYKLVSASVEH